MNIVNLFDKYFVALILIQGFIIFFIDYKEFKRNNMNKTARQAKVIAITEVCIAVAMYVISITLY
ncbi:hypothetical protein BD780_004021 [Clostridium tetanomorphum]|uniref:Uncharacterized protein n=1 Tax=Clostridium tetanomorphum TaxID=1553 RepID=A0A923ECH4_CLOTT|nr:CLC_0170 family protein [Clostridium tetanomorphum]KAJ48896.1 hypothetical protein CTM_25943 [Clostridium tetanomorphum DSM 665]KAJ53292.1 hypothetical protein CTM_03339 [Clostridium tetanomorphum DSM 665]MBC2399412.1 hypothetical protein [Clostridium tetanomorphum]MBP1865676.1 hypothetical protein [Clostridium tetanomorphum]NRS86796.1 hypothetical protein [Clostridium tetanomorphum]